MSLSPRRCRWGRRRSGEQRLDIRTRRDKIVSVELEVPIAPVDMPFSASLRVPQPGNWKACPLRPEVGPPWWPTLEDRHGTVIDIDLFADLVTSAFRQSGVARIDPAADAGEVSLRERHVERAYQSPR